ncbi:MAG: AraC family transcriptional regulator [Bifidobacteriaceae bacterium]|jgi:AraC-like DNA-binding protein|nr:AraC family transcriptional regulator [Bifidobacteriaceae bacterium]
MTLSPAESLKRRRDLLASLNPPVQFTRIFDHLRGVHFFVKDRQGVILFASVGLANLYGFDSEAEFIGRTDFDVLPVGLAEKFRRDDITVMQAAAPMLGIVELFPNAQGIPDWFLTNKFPLRDRSGQVVGLMGSIQTHRASADGAVPARGIEVAVRRMRQDPGEPIAIRKLAELCRMSVRQFEIRFKEAYGLAPNQFRIRLRIMRACELLRDTDAPVAAVAEETGFYDQSALSHHFRKVMGHTPLQYRLRFADPS